MANHKSALKRVRQTKKRTIRNRVIRSTYRTALKKFLELVEAKNVEEAKKQLPAIHKMIDKTCAKGVIKKNTASRKKSRLTVMLNKVSA